MILVKEYVRKHPEIKTKLKQARIDKSPDEYVKETIFTSIIFSLAIVIACYLFTRGNISIYALTVIFIISYMLMFRLVIHRIDARINKLGREIDREIIYSGRFLLIKLSAGRPLLNTIIDASKSYGSGAKYFREIVKEIELGSSVEEALQRAIMYSPSEKLRKILFQINNALRVGIDVTKFLEATIEEIENEQLLEIKRYGKKLSSITLMYLLFGIVIPSLGLSLASVIGTLVGLEISTSFFAIMLLFIIIVQLIFISIFRSIRPNVEV